MYDYALLGSNARIRLGEPNLRMRPSSKPCVSGPEVEQDKVKFSFALKNSFCIGQCRGVVDADVGHAAANAKPQRFRIKRVALHDQESLRIVGPRGWREAPANSAREPHVLQVHAAAQ